MSEDSRLVQRLNKRDQDALNELYKRYQPLVHSMAMSVLRNETLAEEVTQDIFLRLWQKPDKWDPAKGQLSSWLLTVTRYTAIDRLRHEQRRPALEAKPLEQFHELLGNNATHNTHQHDNSMLMRKLIPRLPQEQKQVIFLAFFRGMTHSDIAAELNIPLGTVKSRIRLGMEKLKQEWLAENADLDSEKNN